jgi:hypothetical protein
MNTDICSLIPLYPYTFVIVVPMQGMAWQSAQMKHSILVLNQHDSNLNAIGTWHLYLALHPSIPCMDWLQQHATSSPWDEELLAAVFPFFWGTAQIELVWAPWRRLVIESRFDELSESMVTGNNWYWSQFLAALCSIGLEGILEVSHCFVRSVAIAATRSPKLCRGHFLVVSY